MEPVLILGMHRSGTSCLAGGLQAAGLYLGDVFTANPHNKKGNRESARVMALNSALLKYSGGNWHKPPTEMLWTDDHRNERDAIIESMKEAGEKPWGFKDPRFLFTLPFWKEAIPNPLMVASFRHPNAVAASLTKRNGISREACLKLWNRYNAKLLEYIDLTPLPIINFDAEAHSYFVNMERLSHFVSLRMSHMSASFFEEELRTHQPDNESEMLPPETADIYARLMSVYNEQNRQ